MEDQSVNTLNFLAVKNVCQFISFYESLSTCGFHELGKYISVWQYYRLSVVLISKWVEIIQSALGALGCLSHRWILESDKHLWSSKRMVDD